MFVGVSVGVFVGVDGVFVGVSVGVFVGVTGVFVGVSVGVFVGATGVFVGVSVGVSVGTSDGPFNPVRNERVPAPGVGVGGAGVEVAHGTGVAVGSGCGRTVLGLELFAKAETAIAAPTTAASTTAMITSRTEDRLIPILYRHDRAGQSQVGPDTEKRQ